MFNLFCSWFVAGYSSIYSSIQCMIPGIPVEGKSTAHPCCFVCCIAVLMYSKQYCGANLFTKEKKSWSRSIHILYSNTTCSCRCVTHSKYETRKLFFLLCNAVVKMILYIYFQPFLSFVFVRNAIVSRVASSCLFILVQLDDMEAKRLQDLNIAASAEGADEETKARCDADSGCACGL